MKSWGQVLVLTSLLALSAGAAWADEEAPSSEAQESEQSAADADFVHEESEVAPQWGRGPIEISDPYILAFYRARTWATTPEVLPHLKGSVALRGIWANSFGFETGRMSIDAEVRQVETIVRLGILDRFQAGLIVNYQWRGGGAMDGFIEGFHKAFGLPNSDRDRRPRYRYQVTGLQADGTSFALDHDGYGFGDLVLEGRAQILKGNDLLPALTGTVRMRLPTGRAKFDMSDGIDWTFGLDASKRLGSLPLIFYTGVSYTYHDEARIDGLEFERHRVFFYLGLEWEITPKLSAVVHTWLESRRETLLWQDRAGIPRHDLLVGNWVSYIAGGVKFEPLEGLTFELGALENLIDPEVTADFGVFFSVTLEI